MRIGEVCENALTLAWTWLAARECGGQSETRRMTLHYRMSTSSDQYSEYQQWLLVAVNGGGSVVHTDDRTERECNRAVNGRDVGECVRWRDAQCDLCTSSSECGCAVLLRRCAAVAVPAVLLCVRVAQNQTALLNRSFLCCCTRLRSSIACVCGCLLLVLPQPLHFRCIFKQDMTSWQC